MKTEIIKEVVANKIIHNVIDKATGKVIGKYILTSTIETNLIKPVEKPLIILTVNGMDN